MCVYMWTCTCTCGHVHVHVALTSVYRQASLVRRHPVAWSSVAARVGCPGRNSSRVWLPDLAIMLPAANFPIERMQACRGPPTASGWASDGHRGLRGLVRGVIVRLLSCQHPESSGTDSSTRPRLGLCYAWWRLAQAKVCHPQSRSGRASRGYVAACELSCRAEGGAQELYSLWYPTITSVAGTDVCSALRLGNLSMYSGLTLVKSSVRIMLTNMYPVSSAMVSAPVG